MSYEQWVVPNLNATDATGMCLRFVQRVFQNLNPYYYQSATEAWQKAVHKSYERNFPDDVSVPVYFSHWGTYGSPPRYADWGHVLVRVPGRGYLSSPTWGHGQQWFSTIEEVERAFNCSFRGWALDVGGLNVAWPKAPAPAPIPNVKPKPIPVPAPTPLEEIMINPVYIRDAKTPSGTVYALNTVTGKKRAIPTHEWNGIRAAERAGGEKIVIGSVSADDLKKIPNA